MNRTQRRVRRQYRRINNANAELTIIRMMCEHENVERVNYEYRVGCIVEGTVVCADCGEVIDSDLTNKWDMKYNLNTKEK